MAYFYLLRQLWHYAGKHRWKVAVGIILNILACSVMIFGPYVFAQILNALQTEPRERIFATVSHWCLVWVGIYALFNLFHRFARYFEFNSAFKARQNFINHHYHVVTHLPMKWHVDNHSGATINRINSAASVLNDFGSYQFAYIDYFVSFWGPLIALYVMSWQISLLTFGIAITSLLVIRQFDKRLVTLYQQLNEIKHKFSATLFDYISNIRTIITLRVANKTAEELDTRIEAMYKPYIHANALINALKWLCVNIATVALKIGVVFYYIWLQLSKGNTILVGNAAAVFQYVDQISNSFFNIAREYQRIIQWKTDYMAALPISAAYQQLEIKERSAIASWEHVSISGLNFDYNDSAKTLDNVSLSFTKGEKIALVGTSGSGKSSLMTIFRGLYAPQDVALTIDGTDYRDFSPLHDTTTLIPQDPEIFENTVLFNITMGGHYSDAEITDAIHLAKFDSVLQKMPQGLDTDMRERGVTLSGGEKQRLALARGLLAATDSTIILMDEPTSSVDIRNEHAIYTNVFAHFKDRTVISSIHRLNLLPMFDTIIVMEHGKVIESGSFDALSQDGASHLSRYLKKLHHHGDK